MTATPALDWLFSLQRFGMKPGLERMERLLEQLGNPHVGPRVILVAGTNGKGSTAAMLAAVFQAAGHITGLYSSPHLTDINERFRVDGTDVPVATLEEACARLRPAAESCGATFFEVMTALAWVLFRDAGCQVCVMEVGMGGRFDATNLSDPELSIITNVELDHTEVLGDTVRQIAREKAGVMRHGRPVVTAATGEALTELELHALRSGALLHTVHPSGYTRGQVKTGGLMLRPLLQGSYQASNAAVAVRAAQLLGLPGEAIVMGIGTARLSGRLEELKCVGRNWLLDGAHNPAGARALAASLADAGRQPDVVILGVSAGKDVAQVAGVLGRLAPHAVVTAARLSPRALTPQELAAHLPADVNVHHAVGPLEAVDIASGLAPPDGLILVAGSLYLLGEVRPLLTGARLPERERMQ